MKFLGIETHPIADAMPAYPDDKYKQLRDDIKANGLYDRRLYTYEGKWLDGVYRARACEELGIEPEIVEYVGDDPRGFAASRNFHRRHMNESQRAIAVTRLAALKPGRPRKTSTDRGLSVAEAAAIASVGESTVLLANQVVRETTPNVVAAVERGDLTLSRARELAALDRSEQDAALKEVLDNESQRTRGAAARAKRPANDEQVDAGAVIVKAISRAIRDLGGTVRAMKRGHLEVALNGQVIGIEIAAHKDAA